MAEISIEKAERLNRGDLHDLCTATADAITEGIGFNWLQPPPEETLESFWKGVLVIPERTLFVGRLDGTVASAVQLVRPARSQQYNAFTIRIETHFVAPWARGHGLAKELLKAAEEDGKFGGFTLARLSVRDTQDAAIQLYEQQGYQCWGTLPKYEKLSGQYVAGRFYCKDL